MDSAFRTRLLPVQAANAEHHAYPRGAIRVHRPKAALS